MPAPTDLQTTAPTSADELAYHVAGMTCEHCRVAVSDEVGQVAGVEAIEVDLERKLVRVRGAGLDDAAVRAAIGEAGYEAVRS